MKECVCDNCNEHWFVKEGKEKNIKGCPFCLNEFYKPKEIIVCSFETAIQKVLASMTTEILKERNRFIAYLLDIGTQFRKEIHILSNACDDGSFLRLYDISKLSSREAKKEFSKFKCFLVEEEGISEIWAELICNSFYYAIYEDEQETINTDKLEVVETTKDALVDTSSINKESVSSQSVDFSSEIRCSEDKKTISLFARILKLKESGGNSYDKISSLLFEDAISKLEKYDLSIGGKIKVGNNRWKIIDIRSDGISLLCEDYFETHAFHSEYMKTTWSQCSLRKWLNNEYISKSFSLDEIKYILDTRNETQISLLDFPDVSPITIDKVFIFSADEFEKYKHLMESNYAPCMLRSPSSVNGHDFVMTYENKKTQQWGVRVDYPIRIKPVIRLDTEYFINLYEKKKS